MRALLAGFSILVALWFCAGAGDAATLLPNGRQTFVDANGVPISGGRVYFYIPNTLTPKTTWQDPAGLVPNTNPVVLDSAGRATIYGTGAYRQILKDQAGNLVWDKLTQGYGGAGVTINTTLLGSATIASCSGLYPVANASSLPIVLTLPPAPQDGDTCEFLDTAGTAGTYSITLVFGSLRLTTGASTFSLQYNWQDQTLVFLGAQNKWALR